MNAIFKPSFSNTGRRSALFVACLAIAALGLVAIPAHKALAADTLSSAVYQDTNHDGIVDHIQWTMDENVTACAYELGDWSVNTAGTVGVTGVTGLSCNGNDAVLNIAVTVSTTNVTGGGTNPVISYSNQGVAGSVTLASGAMSNKASKTATDGANPILVSLVVTRNGTPGNYDDNDLTFTYSEDMTTPGIVPSTASFGDITTAGTVAGLGSFATPGDMTVPTGKSFMTAVSNIVLVGIAKSAIAGAYINAGSTTAPSGIFTPVAAANVHDAANNLVAVSHTVTPTVNVAWDLTPPSISSVTLADAAGNNGEVDRATVVFSEQVRDSNISNGDATLGGAGHTGTFTSGTANDNTTQFNLTADNLAVDTSATAAQFLYSAATTPITDRAGNLLVSAAGDNVPGHVVADDIVETDGANPIITAVQTTTSSSRNVINFTYSEPMVATTTASTATNGDITTVGTVEGIGNFVTDGDVVVNTTKNTISGSGTATISIILANETGGYINTGASTVPSGNVAPLANAGLHDAVGLTVNTSAAAVASTAGTAWQFTRPTLTSITVSDANHNGRIDTATLLFSIPMRDANFAAADGTLNAIVGGFTTGLTANDGTVVFADTSDAAQPVDTTAAQADFVYTGASRLITDAYGNLLGGLAAPGAIASGDVVEADGAAPVIVTTSPAASATSVTLTAPIVATFSEAMNGPGTACTFTSAPNPGGFDLITAGANWSNGNKTVTLAHSSSYTRGTLVTITVGGCTAAAGSPSALATNPAVANPWTFTTLVGTSGGGGGGTTVTPASVTLSIPDGGNTLTGGSTVGISWSSANGAFVSYRVSYSSDNGNNWTVLAANVSGTSYSWTVPSASTTQGLIKVEGLDSSGTVIASDTSASTFVVAGTTVPPPPVAPPSGDSTVTGSYDAATAKANNPDFNTDMNLPAASPFTAWCVSGSLIKTESSPSVYYCGNDGKRYVFVNDKAYFSWYPDFSTVQTIIEQTMAKIAIGGNITYRPGSRMIKIQSDPKVYAVARGGVLRWIQTEAAAARLYGANWNQQIDDVSDSFFVNYTIGEPITQ